MCTWIIVGQETQEKTVQRDTRMGQVSTTKISTTLCPPTNFGNCSTVLSENLGRQEMEEALRAHSAHACYPYSCLVWIILLFVLTF